MLKIHLANKGFAHLGIVLLVLALAVVGGAGAYVYHRNHKAKSVITGSTSSSTKSTSVPTKPTTATPKEFQLPKNWEWYTNIKYGFKFAHPSSWGQPTIFSGKGNVGTSFVINFYPPPTYKGAIAYNSRTPIVILMQTNDYSFKSCNDGGCRTNTASTKASIMAVLSSIAKGTYNPNTNTTKQIKGGLIAHDDTSYTLFHTDLPNGGDNVDALVIDKIVNLTKANISGAYISYGVINAPTTCKSGALSDDSQPLCVNANDVDVISQVADSIENS